MITEQDKEIVKEFNSLLAIVDHETTNEILEYLFELKDVENYYNGMPENIKKSLGNIKYIKKSKVENALNKKFRKFRDKKKEHDLLLSFMGEIFYCKERFPEYEDEFNKMLIKIKYRLEEINLLDDDDSNDDEKFKVSAFPNGDDEYRKILRENEILNKNGSINKERLNELLKF